VRIDFSELNIRKTSFYYLMAKCREILWIVQVRADAIPLTATVGRQQQRCITLGTGELGRMPPRDFATLFDVWHHGS
jgi:hypothetical protein